MDRINTATKALDLFGPGKHGFKDGNLSLAIQPTDLDAAFFNDLQEELVGVVEGAGLTPTAGVRTQLRQAIEIMISGSTGNDYKASVRVATTANIASLNGGAPNTLDGVTLAANNRILVKDQATPSQNGIYYVATLGTGANGIWLRAVDSDGAGELSPGTLVAVEEGTALADTLWLLSTDGPITIGTTGIQFIRRDSGAANTSQLASGSVVPTANTLVITLDPSTTDFRSSSLTSGARTSVTNSSAISLVVPVGATLGDRANVTERHAVLELNVGGVKEVAVANLSGVRLNESGLISTTAISGVSTDPKVVYSQTARTDVPYRVRMIYDSNQVTPGTYAAPLSLVQPLGGQAVLAALGYNPPTNVFSTPGRTVGTVYYNMGGTERRVWGFLNENTDSAVRLYISLRPPGTTGGSDFVIGQCGYGRSGAGSNGVGIARADVPPGWGYLFTGTLQGCYEQQM